MNMSSSFMTTRSVVLLFIDPIESGDIPGMGCGVGVPEGEGLGVAAGILWPSCCAVQLMLRINRSSAAYTQIHLVIITSPIKSAGAAAFKHHRSSTRFSDYLRSLLFNLRVLVFPVATAFLPRRMALNVFMSLHVA